MLAMMSGRPVMDVKSLGKLQQIRLLDDFLKFEL